MRGTAVSLGRDTSIGHMGRDQDQDKRLRSGRDQELADEFYVLEMLSLRESAHAFCYGDATGRACAVCDGCARDNEYKDGCSWAVDHAPQPNMRQRLKCHVNWNVTSCAARVMGAWQQP